ncbi:hypothetical protein ACPWUF_01120 [Bisgaard Taxon 46]
MLNKEPKVSEATRQFIQAVIEQYAFRPS